jgi:hypothetical protein
MELNEERDVERSRVAGGGVLVWERGDVKSDIDPEEVDEDEQLGGPFRIWINVR